MKNYLHKQMMHYLSKNFYSNNPTLGGKDTTKELSKEQQDLISRIKQKEKKNQDRDTRK